MSKYATDYAETLSLTSTDYFQIVVGGVDKRASLTTLGAYVATAMAATYQTSAAFTAWLSGTYAAHAAAHYQGSGSGLELDALRLKFAGYTPAHFSAVATWITGGSANQAGAWIAGIDAALGALETAAGAHAAQHELGGSLAVRAAYLDASAYAPSAYTSTAWGGVGTSASHVAGHFAGIDAALALRAPLASPTLTGTPTAPTAAPGTNTTQLATTAFVKAADDILAAEVALRAPLASPALTGTPAAPTAAPGTATTQLATTAFVAAGLALKAPLASPALTGTPTAPTAAAGTVSEQLATTSFVGAANSVAHGRAITGGSTPLGLSMGGTYLPVPLPNLHLGPSVLHTTTGTTSIGVPVDGVYWIFFQVSYTGTDGETHRARVAVNGVEKSGLAARANSAEASLSAMGVYQLSAGDSVRVELANLDSGNDATVTEGQLVLHRLVAGTYE